MSNIRRVSGLVLQGSDEVRIYQFDFASLVEDFGNPISVASCTLIVQRTGVDVSATKLAGDAELNGTISNSKRVYGTEKGITYQLNVALNFPNDEVLSAYLLIKGER
jgi:hypothetical protein